MAEEDVVVAWSFAPVPEAVKQVFRRPTRFVVLPVPEARRYGEQIRRLADPTPARGLLRRFAPQTQPLRIAALGFSESCAGVLALLRSSDGARFDAAVAIDGIHTAPAREPNPNALFPWVSFAHLAGKNERLCAITHSSNQPPYASTTATAQHIWERSTGTPERIDFPPVGGVEAAPTSIRVGSPPANRPYTVNYPRPAQQPPKRLNGLVVLGYDNVDPNGYADHIYQARVVLPIVVARFLATRWNAIDPKDPNAVCFVA